jgi:hypothetical protein
MEMFIVSPSRLRKTNVVIIGCGNSAIESYGFQMHWFSNHQTGSRKRYVWLSNPLPALRAVLSQREREGFLNRHFDPYP